MLDTCDGFLLLLRNLAFEEISELNASIWFVAISVSRQSVSQYRVLNARTRCVSIHLIFSKVSIVDFNGRRDIWLCPVIHWVHCWDWCCDQWTNCSVLAFWDALLEFGRLVWSVMDLICCSSPVVAPEDCFRRNFSVEWFCLICYNISTKRPISRLAFWKFRFGAIQFIVFSEVLIADSNGRWDINSFVPPFFGFKDEAVVEVGESSARVWPFGTRC